MQATREDVISCYRHILGREPENEETLSRLIGWDFWQLVSRFAHSDEHRANVARLSTYSPLKFRREGSIARSISDEVRLSAIVHNYAFLREKLTPVRLKALMESGLPLMGAVYSHISIEVSASMFDGPAEEGEISLTASLECRKIAVLSFTFIAGEEFGLPYGPSILISRVQGYRGVADDYTTFTASTGVAPPLFLFSVLEGIAAASGISSVLAVDARNHPSFRDEDANHYERAYDLFFTEMGGTPYLPGFYRFKLPRVLRPLDQGSVAHRARRRKRRLVRQQVTDQAAAKWRSFSRPPVPTEIKLPSEDREPTQQFGFFRKLAMIAAPLTRLRRLRV